jgi:hypothetical protein
VAARLSTGWWVTASGRTGDSSGDTSRREQRAPKTVLRAKHVPSGDIAKKLLRTAASRTRSALAGTASWTYHRRSRTLLLVTRRHRR